MQVKKLIKTSDQLDLYRYFIEIYLLITGRSIKQQSKTVLLYFMTYGIEKGSELLLEKELKNKGCLNTLKSELVTDGYLLKKPWRLSEELSLVKIDNLIDFHIRCRNEKQLEM